MTAHLVVGVRYRLGGCDGLIALLSLVVDVRYLCEHIWWRVSAIVWAAAVV